MKTLTHNHFAATLLLALLATAAGAGDAAQAMVGNYNAPAREDEAAIRTVLSNYTDSVSRGDRALFESQLLDLAIPFSGIGGKNATGQAGLAAVQNYAGFRAAIFDGGVQYTQRFSNIKIEQLGKLAQVSLDYETTVRGQPYQGKGWKVLQLVNIDHQWKIASELWTGYPGK